MNAYLFLNTFYLFIYFWLCWVFVAAPGLSLVVVSRGYSLVEMHRLLIVVASRCKAQAPGTPASVVAAHRLSSCSLQALDCGLSS